MTCDWCIEGKCRCGDENKCDFKSLPMDQSAIQLRIEFEVDQVEAKLREVKKTKDEKEIFKLIADTKDRVEGIKIMQDVLESTFGVKRSKTIKNPFRFMQAVLSVNKYLGKLKKEKVVDKDENKNNV